MTEPLGASAIATARPGRHLTDLSDPALVMFRLRDRELAARKPSPEAPNGLFVAEGDLVVERALDLGYVPFAALADEKKVIPVVERFPATMPLYLAPEPERMDITELGVTLGVIALFHRRPLQPWDAVAAQARFMIGLEAVVNPSNLGAIVRTATALGADGMLLEATCADPYARRAVRTSMGSSLHLPFGRPAGDQDGWLEALVSLRERGVRVLGLTPSPDATPIDSLSLAASEPRILLLGSERAGLSDAALAVCEPVVIPMAAGVDSLNVAAAAAIACHTLRPTP
jgi:tRNA G18 (ribose-2'-O)-methylase SpoU